ncbi:MAG TPA: hypothetical protein EYP36_00905 [Calditrichaeota bacterium]|nr:hypothetical protein [Calditrichota bacterium]
MKLDQTTYQLSDTNKLQIRTLGAGIIALLISVAGYFFDSQQFFASYLVAYLFWVSITLGALFFVMLFHLTGTAWGIVLRRIIEAVMMTIPLMAIMFIPIILGMHDLYHWSHADAVAADPILQKKAGYLNVTFFVIRSAVYFGLWYLIARKLYKTSLAMDENPSVEQVKKLRKISAPGMIVFALTISFAAFDWLMSLDPHWYSTIFGLYYFSGALLGALGIFLLIALHLRAKGILVEEIKVDHYHDLAKFLFGFTIFWGYMAFSQYLLIWYANIPEETIFYHERWVGTWKILALTQVFGNFLIPFVGLLTRNMKRNLPYLKKMTIWILLMHWFDLYWVAMPNFHHHGIALSWMDLTLFVGMGGLFMWFVWRTLAAHAVIPINDPKLEESLRLEIS